MPCMIDIIVRPGETVVDAGGTKTEGQVASLAPADAVAAILQGLADTVAGDTAPDAGINVTIRPLGGNLLRGNVTLNLDGTALLPWRDALPICRAGQAVLA